VVVEHHPNLRSSVGTRRVDGGGGIVAGRYMVAGKTTCDGRVAAFYLLVFALGVLWRRQRSSKHPEHPEPSRAQGLETPNIDVVTATTVRNNLTRRTKHPFSY
jgi:hypothetical protein